MSKLSAFTFITLNGYFEGPEKGNISWHRHGKEENEYAAAQLQSESMLLFGRITYQMMVNYWPTPIALENDPEVAKGMNSSAKIVFSKTLRKAEWHNTTLIKDNMIETVKKLKTTSAKNMTILGSGTIVTQLAEKNLIDEYQIMIDPVVIGKGTSLFKNINRELNLKLITTKTLKSGTLLLCYSL